MGRLTRKRRAWIEEYLKCWNATEAARRVGYKHPNTQGPRLLLDVGIQSLIEDRLEEKTLSADEVLLRLGEHARAEYSEYLYPNGTVDLDQMLEDGKGHLIKGIKWDRNENRIVEFYDSQAALVHIGKHHKLFTERHEVTGADGGALRVIFEEQENWRAGADLSRTENARGTEDGV